MSMKKKSDTRTAVDLPVSVRRNHPLSWSASVRRAIAQILPVGEAARGDDLICPGLLALLDRSWNEIAEKNQSVPRSLMTYHTLCALGFILKEFMDTSLESLVQLPHELQTAKVAEMLDNTHWDSSQEQTSRLTECVKQVSLMSKQTKSLSRSSGVLLGVEDSSDDTDLPSASARCRDNDLGSVGSHSDTIEHLFRRGHLTPTLTSRTTSSVSAGTTPLNRARRHRSLQRATVSSSGACRRASSSSSVSSEEDLSSDPGKDSSLMLFRSRSQTRKAKKTCLPSTPGVSNTNTPSPCSAVTPRISDRLLSPSVPKKSKKSSLSSTPSTPKTPKKSRIPSTPKRSRTPKQQAKLARRLATSKEMLSDEDTSNPDESASPDQPSSYGLRSRVVHKTAKVDVSDWIDEEQAPWKSSHYNSLDDDDDDSGNSSGDLFSQELFAQDSQDWHAPPAQTFEEEHMASSAVPAEVEEDDRKDQVVMKSKQLKRKHSTGGRSQRKK